jgi:pimeloyl-ACP methyl ester carboxylesterase
VQTYVDVAPAVRLWVEDEGSGDATPILLIMGANASGLAWPELFVSLLAERHRVIRYDHRDTGQSTWAFDDQPYAVADLAGDAVRILDALEIESAHVVGMSMGGTLVQLLLLDHPERLRSATLFCTSALGVGLAAGEAGSPPNGAEDVAAQPVLPDIDPRLLELWSHLADPRSREEELEFRVEHWRLLNGRVLPFEPQEFRALETRLIDHAGTHANPAAHARASQANLDRGAELRKVRVPTLVIEAPEDPINPPPHASYIASLIPTSRLVRIDGMGHALPHSVLGPLARAILDHMAEADAGTFARD